MLDKTLWDTFYHAFTPFIFESLQKTFLLCFSFSFSFSENMNILHVDFN